MRMIREFKSIIARLKSIYIVAPIQSLVIYCPRMIWVHNIVLQFYNYRSQESPPCTVDMELLASQIFGDSL